MVSVGSVSDQARIRVSLAMKSRARKKAVGAVEDQECAKRVGELEKFNGSDSVYQSP
jgi:hypothetical protein